MPVLCNLISSKNLLMHFTTYIGLRVNYDKSMIVPINTAHEKMLELAQVMGCKVGSLPFTYLGLPLCLSKPKIEHFMPIMKRIERRLAECSSLLSYGDKLVLVKSLSIASLFSLCALYHRQLVSWSRSKNTWSISSGENMVWKIRVLPSLPRTKCANLKIKVVLEFLTLPHTTNACLWSISTSFSINMMFLGSSWFGILLPWQNAQYHTLGILLVEKYY